jgi:hypothetical protein
MASAITAGYSQLGAWPFSDDERVSRKMPETKAMNLQELIPGRATALCSRAQPGLNNCYHNPGLCSLISHQQVLAAPQV